MEEELQLPRNPSSVTIQHSHDDDDDPPTLSAQTLAALKDFLSQQSHSVSDAGDGDSTVALVAEDWRLSQFWYDRNTAETLVEEVLALCRSSSSSESESPRVACIACPTLYAYLKNVDSGARIQLLEYDKRFEQYGGDFTFYDYNQPEELPLELRNAFDVIVADPPYLSQECLEKVAQTISFLRRSESCVLLLTGEVQKDRAGELLGLHPCGFRPQHSNKLGNEFRLYTSYDPHMRLGGWDRDK